jgi:glutathionylspermidine synthase
VSSIALELEAALKTLPPVKAQAVEQEIRRVLAGATGAEVPRKESHREFIERMAGSFGNEPFERPPQGEFEKREEW